MKRLRVSHRAERDLDRIWHHVASETSSIRIADRLIDSIVTHFALLARQPNAGRSREDIDPGVRSFPSGNYLIYYRVAKSHLVIFRILHGETEQPGAWQEPD